MVIERFKLSSVARVWKSFDFIVQTELAHEKRIKWKDIQYRTKLTWGQCTGRQLQGTIIHNNGTEEHARVGETQRETKELGK